MEEEWMWKEVEGVNLEGRKIEVEMDRRNLKSGKKCIRLPNQKGGLVWQDQANNRKKELIRK